MNKTLNKQMQQHGTLIFFCGKMGAGKSTKSRQIAQERNAVLLSEDEWLAALYPNQISSFDDYIKYSALLRPLVKKHVTNILQTGTNVVMDFPANTVRQRAWFKDLASKADAAHEMIYLDVSNELCLRQIAQRSIEQPKRAAFDTPKMFEEVTKYFEEPSKNEDLNIVIL